MVMLAAATSVPCRLRIDQWHVNVAASLLWIHHTWHVHGNRSAWCTLQLAASSLSDSRDNGAAFQCAVEAPTHFDIHSDGRAFDSRAAPRADGSFRSAPSPGGSRSSSFSQRPSSR